MTLAEKRFNFNRRVQEAGESVDPYAVALKEFAAKCEFQGEEYKHRLVVQFILGISDRSTQNRLCKKLNLIYIYGHHFAIFGMYHVQGGMRHASSFSV